MSISDKAKELFSDVDSNRDGKIDKDEFRNWIARPKDSTTTMNDEQVVHTTSSEETNRILETASNIYRDPNPRIVRRPTTERPVTHEQRIRVKYLQPPPLPPPEPLIVKEIRPEQPPPPPPLVIREKVTRSITPPPLILRERPPIPPPRIRSETVARYLPAIPVPPRSVVVERFQSIIEKPRDIVIERWLPYGPQPERQTIVKRAPPPREYDQPTNTIIIHDNVQVRIARKFEKLGISQEDPESYLARYGSSLLDSTTLVQEARGAGVVEDISVPDASTSGTTFRSKGYDFDRSNEVYTSTGYTGLSDNNYSGGQRYTTGTEVISSGTRICSVCGSPLGSKNSFAGGADSPYSTSHPADININITTKKISDYSTDNDRQQYI